jgi:CDP-4-dehydro-6-deoxyglucose reductase
MTHRVTLHPSASPFDCAPGQAILKAGLAAGLRLPFSCRSGMCRTCKGRVVSGQVDFGDAHVKYLSEAERAQGFALLCCASPLSDLVVEVEEIVETGEMHPDSVHLPGIYVHRIVLNAKPEKRIEKRTITEKAGV